LLTVRWVFTKLLTKLAASFVKTSFVYGKHRPYKSILDTAVWHTGILLHRGRKYVVLQRAAASVYCDVLTMLLANMLNLHLIS
jgi:hypothetical protein